MDGVRGVNKPAGQAANTWAKTTGKWRSVWIASRTRIRIRIYPYLSVLEVCLDCQQDGKLPPEDVLDEPEENLHNYIKDLPMSTIQENGFLFIWVINNKYKFALEFFDKWKYK